MKRINRKEAIYFLATYGVFKLTNERREAILIDCYSENDDFEKITDFSDVRYDHDVIRYLADGFVGIHNQYIADSIMNIISIANIMVEGNVEQLEKCPCCEYHTLEEGGQYFVCPVCFWEDDGSDELERYSPVNRGYLKNARANFISFGAMSESSIESIDPEGRKKYLQ